MLSEHMADSSLVTEQPKVQQGMEQKAGGNRNAKGLPVGPQGRPWSYGLYNCCDDVSTCCFATWCCCIIFNRNKRRFDHLNNSNTPDPEHGRGGGIYSPDCCCYCLGFGPALQGSARSSIRTRYNIEGDTIGDCWAVACCTPCALVQESREIALEEESFTSQPGLKEPRKV